MSNDKDTFSVADLTAALKDEDRAGLVNALKHKLQNLAGQGSDVLESLTPTVRKRVDALRDIQGQHDELEAKFREERAVLEAKYQKLYQPLYTKVNSGTSGKMETFQRDELSSFLNILPPVDFCCVYGSTLHPNNQDKTKMVDYIIGVSDPMKWHSENLKMNSDHYASWMVHLGGARLITNVADKVGVGVHFNPFVNWNDRKLKYGVVRMHDLIQDILDWNRLYLSGRLQKPVQMLVDNFDIEVVNSVNKRAAISAALLLLPPKFTEEDLYAKICSLSYMGDLRMYFAEDSNKVNKIVKGQFNLFQSMYKPFLEECETKNLMRSASVKTSHSQLVQDSSLSATRSLVSCLPASVKSQMEKSLGEKKIMSETGRVTEEVCIGSREEAVKFMEKVMRRRVMVSSGRQAVSGFLTAGAINATMYLFQKMRKAWTSSP